MDMRAAVTNVQVGKDIDLDHTTVSRIRSGDRLPSLNAMIRIETRYRWKLHIQARARLAGRYAEAFEKALVYEYGEDTVDVTAAP